ncbi:MAG: iron-containing alcohol dehydrogenase [Oscillospiraceae bacterium]|nr:iron-containing alcohol dehydrogenase [Oscillospiraceae bacterium]
MIMDCSKYVGKCVCGKEHSLETKMVVVEYGALQSFEKYMEAVGLAGKRRTVVYDSVVYKITEGKHVRADQEIILPAEGLRSEDILIEDMMKKLEDPEVIVTVGAGTMMDFGRYPAYKLGIPFVAIPTLASSDGFTARICSVIIEGQKKSIPMKAPELVVADLDIIKGAPKRLVASGINDILAKYVSLADWKIATLVSGEDFCPMIYDLAKEALDIMRAAADKYAASGEIDHEAMTMAQMKSGLTMQLWVNSRAASGAEHLIAHLVEMHPPRFENAEGIHGECVGVGTYLCVKKYHELAKLMPVAKAFEPLTEDWIKEKFGDSLWEGIKEENKNDILSSFDPQIIVDNWDKIREIIAEIPPAEELESLYKAVGSKYLPEHIGIDPALTDEILPISAAIRNRLTLIRMLRVLDFQEK